MEITYTSSAREFTETELDASKTAGVLEQTGTNPTLGLGSDGDPVFGFLDDLTQDGAAGSFLTHGLTDWVFYAAAAEDPDVNDSVLSKGDGSVKQTPTATDVAAGGITDGRGIVFAKDTTNTKVKLSYP